MGEADIYSWKEEQFEIEVKLSVPSGTSAKFVKFKTSPNSIDLRLLNQNGADGNSVEEKILLDGSRNVRGTICVDGTFWSIEGNPEQDREITITIEKHFVPVSSEGGTQTYDTLTDFDWGGLYPNDEEEVAYRKYDEPEELNVREYASKLGVDIDSIDMSKVDKTMFGAGVTDNDATAAAGGKEGDGDNADDTSSNKSKGFHFNITQATLKTLTKSGLAKEVVQQADGTEYDFGTMDPASMLGKGISDDELREAGIVGESNVPTMWESQTVPVEEAPGYGKTYDTDGSSSVSEGIIESEMVETEITSENTIVDVFATTSEEANKVEINAVEATENAVEADLSREKSTVNEDTSKSKEAALDPIDMLTVARLKEICRAQGLKVSGTKQVLRDRLRSHVNTLLKEEE